MRYAIYFTPDSKSELHQLGSSWLGRDVHSLELITQSDVQLFAVTTSARRYGFHGTLKPPFKLKQGSSLPVFELAVRKLVFQHQRFLTSALELAEIDGFLALRPVSTSLELERLAADCVQRLDDFRAPPNEEELRRRRSQGLTTAQEDLLLLWGYPYVFEEFHFHITLTDRLTEKDLAWVRPKAEQHFAPVLGSPLLIDAISIVIEPAVDEDLRVFERVALMENALQAAS